MERAKGKEAKEKHKRTIHTERKEMITTTANDSIIHHIHHIYHIPSSTELLF